ncbi:MAG: DUF4011 domain-containing protein [Gemmataceae bacterium]
MANADSLLTQLDAARRDLLELSTRNRLLATPRDQDRGLSLEIKDELSDEIFRMMVTEAKPMRFEQGVVVEKPADEPAAEEKPAEEPAAEEKPKKRKTTTKRVTKKKAAIEPVASIPAAATDNADPHLDSILHTVLAPEELDRRLLRLDTDAKALRDEKGVNILYLVLGFLQWFEDGKPDTPRHAPLLLVPVRLERANVGTRFNLVYAKDDIVTNLTLKIRLKVDFGIDLPDVPDVEELAPSAYFADVKKAIAGQKNWDVLADDMVLWFFSFTKLLMYRDLDPANWPAHCRLEDRPLIRGLLQDGFPSVAPLCPEGQLIDTILDPAQTAHVIDSDSSQSLAIEEACRGRSLIVQGPPGTGKSQAITNLIAGAVKAGKTVLFVAEKMAALEVVKRRLDNIGLGDMCLELHSESASKQAVLKELDRTLKLGKPVPPAELSKVIQRLKDTRDRLNQHAAAMHTPLTPSGLTPYRVLTDLIDLRLAHTKVPDFQMAGAEQWPVAQFEQHAAAVADYARGLGELGCPPEKHPWRGSQLDRILPLDLERLVASIPGVVAKLEPMWAAARTLAQRLGDDPPTTLGHVGRLLRSLRAVLAAPPIDPAAHGGTVWADHRDKLTAMGDHARAILAARTELQGVVTDRAWDADVAQAHDDYARRGQSWFRLLFPSYRAARRTLRGLLVGPQPKTYEERLAILDKLDKYRQGTKKLVEANDLGTKAFGRFWLGAQTDWKQIDAIESWDAATAQANTSPRFRAMLGLLDDRPALTRAADDLEKQFTAVLADLQTTFASVKLDLATAFAHPTPKPGTGTAAFEAALAAIGPAADESLLDLKERLTAWHTQPERLQHWRRHVESRTKVRAVGDGTFAKQTDTGTIPPADMPAAFAFAYREAIFRQMLRDHPPLANFDGADYQRLIDDFQTLDQERILLARTEVADYHYTNIGKPRGPAMKEAVGLLRQEMQKKRRNLPLRQLLHRAGPAVQAIKPVFMMSPLSVAEFLEPGAVEFDLLLIDEASQVRPVEALGAAARCRQMVVVGDDKQMPPTQFFGVVVGDVPVDDGADDAAMQAGDVESILGLAIARNMPQRMLRWHYRSKHQSLIAVSNREFYENQLYILPSPERTGELGLKFHFVDGGRFIDRINPVEAKVVAEAVLDHAAKHPNWTLGVGAFSVTQRDAVLKEVEKLRRERPGTEAFFDPNAPDPFFVKNLENIQGDERDVIFVSVGYGPDEAGRVSLNFGPVSAGGGERRLNVLMTRARRRCEIFSSLRAEDIDLSRATGAGPAVFRAFLQYAQAGDQSTAKAVAGTDRLPELIRKQLTDKGYEVRTHVGEAGVFIDLAVVDPDHPDRYLLGVECDGPSYQSSRTARDRDRLRRQVLQAQGWTLYRVWSLDWFQQPTEQLQKLVNAIEAARRKAGKPSAAGPEALPNVSTVERRDTGTDPLATIDAEAPPPTPGVRDVLTDVAAEILKKTAKDIVDSLQRKAGK